MPHGPLAPSTPHTSSTLPFLYIIICIGDLPRDSPPNFPLHGGVCPSSVRSHHMSKPSELACHTSQYPFQLSCTSPRCTGMRGVMHLQPSFVAIVFKFQDAFLQICVEGLGFAGYNNIEMSIERSLIGFCLHREDSPSADTLQSR